MERGRKKERRMQERMVMMKNRIPMMRYGRMMRGRREERRIGERREWRERRN